MRILLLACVAFSSLAFGADQQQEAPQTRLELLKEQAVVLYSMKAILSLTWDSAEYASRNAARDSGMIAMDAASWDAAMTAAMTAAGDAARDAGMIAVMDAAGDAFMDVAMDGLVDAVGEATDEVARIAARIATRQGRTPQEIGAVAWNAAENAAWEYLQANLYAGDRLWDKATTATRAALAPFGEESFANVVFVFSDNAADDRRMAYFVPFVEKILEASDRLLQDNLERQSIRYARLTEVIIPDLAGIISGYASDLTPRVIF